MTISPGYTNAQIRDYVYQYERLRQGTKALWLEEQPFSRYQLRRWKAAIFGGDLDRGLISRDGGGMIPQERRAYVQRESEDRQAARIAELEARVRELEGTNEALGKAIGLLHQLSEQEPDTPETNGPRDSSRQRTTSSPSLPE